MATTLPQDHIRAIDQLRTRLSQLSTTIGLVKKQLDTNDPLPPWPVLQNASTTLASNMGALAEVLANQQQLFASLHPYPTSDFPGHTQEGLLQQLLRKKLDPKAEDWIDEAEIVQINTIEGVALEVDELKSMWAWAGPTWKDKLKPLLDEGILNDHYTIQERDDGIENVVTGLKRNLDDEDDDNDDDDDDDDDDEEDVDDNEEDDDKMEVEDEAGATADKESVAANGLNITRPPVPLETLLRFATGQ